MEDLHESNVSAMAGALGLTLTQDDVTEVTHRLNAFIEALGPLRDLALDAGEPVPASIDADGAL